ncbi:hypothetical protein [Caulobacter sp.]|uniref:hypothetical protein n=1 Tax=Caulobacter sp. TaxID=78 RepID=UPI001B1E914D|nr:hypothetical protein [Caulobacter sp.]MBO9543830.1 hypothetical protein [Caulobacter sp.]
MPEREDAYEPTSVEVERNIQQGGGVGARDLARQAEPSVIAPEDADEDDAVEESIGRAHPHD